MIRNFTIILFISLVLGCKTQQSPVATTPAPEPEKKEKPLPKLPEYRATYTKYFDLTHTRLSVSLDWKNKELIGEAALILRPHFYSTDSITINARGMRLNEVSLLSPFGKHIPLKYIYDSLLIKIKLDRTYSKDESFTLFFSYVSQPDKLSSAGSAAIRGEKGLYFIDPDSLDAEKPTELWTQGETESNSVWFPTIEDPNQKMTQEIYITVDTAFTTLSNGLLISSTNNYNGTKTDYWKQSLPAAPYLTMIAVGDYKVVTEKWKNIDVSYYVDPPYEKYAHMIFGVTPEMMTFYSDLLGIPFVWEKYAQVVVHDFVTGAMENATATVHGTNLQQTPRKFIDGNYENYIAHELFHHWFGNLVTCESWSNISLNESFANYSEYLWREYKYNRDEADRAHERSLAGYLFVSTIEDPPLFRNAYKHREDVYDGISYNKGGRTLHMLRKLVGDSAFFSSLHLYLSTHMFGNAEVNDLRMAFEKTTGQDLNWFFDQWFMKGGHPILNIDYDWNDSLHQETVTITQNQNFDSVPLYRLPVDVDLYYAGKKEKRKLVIDEAVKKFRFDLPVKPDLINIDAEKMLLAAKTDNKSNKELIFQFDNAPLYMDRQEALTKLVNNYKSYTPEGELVHRALNDKAYGIRLLALNNIGELAQNDTGTVKADIRNLATSDSTSEVREKALTVIGKYYSYSENASLIENALRDTSYDVVARAFKIISEKDNAKAKDIAKELEKDSGDVILAQLAEYYNHSQENKIDLYNRALILSSPFNRSGVIRNFTVYLSNNNDSRIISSGVDILSSRAKKTTSKRSKTAYVNGLKEIESSLGKKITDSANATANNNEGGTKTVNTSNTLDLQTVKNNLHEKIEAIDK